MSLPDDKQIWYDSQNKIKFILEKIRLKASVTTFDTDKKDQILLEGVTLLKEGGILCDYQGYDYPKKGFADADTVMKLDGIKKIFMGFAHGFNNFKGKWAIAIFVFLFRKRIAVSAKELITRVHFMLYYHMLKPERYCTAVRAVYQAFSDKDSQVRDIACMLLEFDDSYRYRFQDAMGTLNQDDFRKNPYKELNRILQHLEDREKEHEQRLKDTWRLLRKILFLITFIKPVRDRIVDVISNLNIEAVKMDEGDLYHAKIKSKKMDSYNYSEPVEEEKYDNGQDENYEDGR